MTLDQIKFITKDRVVTYAKVVIDFRLQTEDQNHVRITAGDNLIDYPGELVIRLADLITSKILLNSVISTKEARYMCSGITSFCLEKSSDRYKS